MRKGQVLYMEGRGERGSRGSGELAELLVCGHSLHRLFNKERKGQQYKATEQSVRAVMFRGNG